LRHAAGALRAELSVDDGNEQGGGVFDVCSWHKADTLNALTNVRFWGQSGR
jgi:hypothetical protein